MKSASHRNRITAQLSLQEALKAVKFIETQSRILDTRGDEKESFSFARRKKLWRRMRVMLA